MTNEQQLANFALELVRGASARCDDVTQQNVATTKQWLGAVRDGVIVTIPVAELKKLQDAAQSADKTLASMRAERASRAKQQSEAIAAEVEALVDASAYDHAMVPELG